MLTHTAITVLSDPHKRAVYDLLGEEGLKSSWEVGQKVPTPEEVDTWYMMHSRRFDVDEPSPRRSEQNTRSIS